MTDIASAENGCKVYITGRRSKILEEAAKAFGTRGQKEGGKGSIHLVQADVSTEEGISRE